MHFICVKDFQTSGEHKWADFFFDEFDERAYLRYCNIQNINCIPVLWQKLLPLNGDRRVHLKAIYSNGFLLLQYKTYKNVSSITKSKSNMHLIGS